jgi:2,4-dienoyl-CoA reductase-like NADH-dependent reductase (Old Yellow Enzyme family)
MYDVTPLFAPLQVQNKTLRNRIVMPPMVVNRGLATPEGCDWYGRRAAGGVGLVIIEATNVVRFGVELTSENLHRLVEAIHRGGALAAIQLFPGVRGQRVSPADLTREQISELLNQYRLAAEICAGAGFDGIEPHGAHGFLLNQFFSPDENGRDDEYSRTLAGRMRLALEIMEAIRPAADRAGMLLLYRHTPVGSGYGVPESLALAVELVKAGLHILDISPASEAAPADRAAPFMKLGVPVIGVNEMDRLPRALEALRENRAALIAVGRALIADADWPAKVRAGRLEDIQVCTYCDECFAFLDRGEPVRCAVWDEVPGGSSITLGRFAGS